MRSLRELNLDDNSIPGFYDGSLRSLPCLTVLSVRNNAVRSIRGLEGLRGLSKLTDLRLDGNPVCLVPEFAAFAAEFLPYLVVVAE